MSKRLIAFLVAVAIIAGMGTCFYMMSKNNNKLQAEVQDNTELSEKVTDECTEEYEVGQTEELEEANSEEEKISPNAVITFERFFKECEHTITRYEEVSEKLVNGTKEDLQKEYEAWKVKSFASDKIVLHKEIEGECGEHYMLRDVNGKINIYKIGENGDEILMEETDIATEYLTDADMIDIQNGLIVYGKESLNMLLEDFE